MDGLDNARGVRVGSGRLSKMKLVLRRQSSQGNLHSQVDPTTRQVPSTKLGVTVKLKRITPAIKLKTMANDVANPLMILSEYLMTRAVTKPPSTCVKTTAQAQTPKLAKIPPLPAAALIELVKTGRIAGRIEKKDN